MVFGLQISSLGNLKGFDGTLGWSYFAFAKNYKTTKSYKITIQNNPKQSKTIAQKT
jgi:hypothetical protein